MNINDNKTYTLFHITLIIFVFMCFRTGIDNFFAGDDFNWLFDTEKMMLYPPHVFGHSNHTYFVRPTESLYFTVNFLLAGFNHISYQLTAIFIHLCNVVLVSLVINQICKNRLAGLIGAIFWGVNYKHTEAVFRPYGVADSLVLLFCLGALLLFLHKRIGLATISFFVGVLAKENAAVFPLLLTIYVYVFKDRQKLLWLKRTLPFWIVGLFSAGLGMYMRAGSGSYLTIDWNALIRLWETMLTYVGPDTIYIKIVYLEGKPYLLPVWAAGILLVIFVILLWKIPRVYQFGFLWMCIMMLPTVFVGHQTSRYYYVPLVGLGIIVGQGLSEMLISLWKRNAQKAISGVCTIYILILIYLIVGVNLEEQDYDFFGEIHRQAAESFTQNILPAMPKNDHTMAVFLKQDSTKLAEELYAKFLLKPWYFPGTYKWVFRRHQAVLGLANTYGFVSYCAYHEAKDTLFVNVPYEEYRQKLLTGDFYVIFHDYETNTFRFGPERLKAEVVKHIDDERFYQFLQPGRFDPTNTGSLYFYRSVPPLPSKGGNFPFTKGGSVNDYPQTFSYPLR